MLETRGIVVDTRGEYAIVEAERQAGCGRCDSAGGCAQDTLGKLFGTPRRRFRALNPALARPGEEVTIVIEDGAVLRSAVVMYLVPLALLVAGAIGGALIMGAAGTANDLYAGAGGAAGLLAGFLSVRYYGLWRRLDSAYHPVIIGRTAGGATSICKETK